MNVEVEEGGMLVDQGDVGGWEKGLEYVDEDGEEGVKMGEKGRKVGERRQKVENQRGEVWEVVVKRFKGQDGLKKE